MTPYFVTIALVMLFSFLAELSRENDMERGFETHQHSKRTILLLVFSVIPIVFTAGFRYNIGADFSAYYHVDKVFKANFWEALKGLDEPGIALIRDIIHLFSHDGAVYIFTFSFLTIVPSIIVLLGRTDDYLFCMMMYIFAGCWHGCFNGVRQYLAATVILLGIRYISERNLVKYAITVFLAFLFHRSAIVMIVPYFVMHNKINTRNVLLLAGGTMLIAMNYETIFSLIGALKEKDVSMSSYSTASVNTLRILANAAPAAAALMLNANKELDEEQTFCINGLIINAAAMIAAANSTYLARISVYTLSFLPMCLSQTIRMKNRNFEFAVRFFIVALFGVFWYMEVSTYSQLSPFKWIFYKDILY